MFSQLFKKKSQNEITWSIIRNIHVELSSLMDLFDKVNELLKTKTLKKIKNVKNLLILEKLDPAEFMNCDFRTCEFLNAEKTEQFTENEKMEIMKHEKYDDMMHNMYYYYINEFEFTPSFMQRARHLKDIEVFDILKNKDIYVLKQILLKLKNDTKNLKKEYTNIAIDI